MRRPRGTRAALERAEVAAGLADVRGPGEDYDLELDDDDMCPVCGREAFRLRLGGVGACLRLQGFDGPWRGDAALARVARIYFGLWPWGLATSLAGVLAAAWPWDGRRWLTLRGQVDRLTIRFQVVA